MKRGAEVADDLPDADPVDELLEIITARGLRVMLGGDGRPVLRGPKGEATKPLLDMLRLYRDDVIDRLGLKPEAEPDVELRWANGYTCPHWFPDKGWPVGARWWRKRGESEWQSIPGGSAGEAQT